MNILYICTHNRCRSILSEAITRQNAQGIINAMSAGSQPSGEVHPL
ncbi:arsenate reductase/protein-tyrosine-phosphatase family protein, partial [Staphylococcus aureus]